MTSPPPGWYPDPAGTGGTRWWDGVTWADHVTRALPSGPTVVQQTPYAGSPMGNVVGPGVPVRPQPRTWLERNRASLAVLGLVALYLVTLRTVHVVVLGVLPAVLAVRAVREREPLAVPAAVLAGCSVAFALYELATG